MPEKQPQDRAVSRLEAISGALRSGVDHHTRMALATLNAAEAGRLIESLPRDKRYFVWRLAGDAEAQGEILSEVSEEVRAHLIDAMQDDELLAAVVGMDMDDLADVFADLPDAVTRELLASMDAQDRQRLESILSYPEDSAGGMMNTDTVTVRPNVTIDVVLRYLRIRGELPELTDALTVVDRGDRLVGALPLSVLLTADPARLVKDVMTTDGHALLADTPADEVARYFETRDLVSAPVVDEGNHLLGRITIDDVVDVIRDEADHDLMRMAGMNEADDMFAPVVTSASRRSVWLGVNLLTALLASWVIGLYETALDKVVALAILMPIVASMGGIAGSQTLILVIRAIALDRLGQSNTRLLLLKEVMVGALNGLLWAALVSLIAYMWFGDKTIGLIIAAALLVNLVFAAAAGVVIPMMLKRLGVDPALAGSVLLTTVTDVIGFMAFLGMATLVLI